MAVSQNSLWVTSDVQIHRFENALLQNQKTSEGYDAVYVPQAACYTGDLDIQDCVGLAVPPDKALVISILLKSGELNWVAVKLSGLFSKSTEDRVILPLQYAF